MAHSAQSHFMLMITEFCIKKPAVVKKVIKEIEKYFGKISVDDRKTFNFLVMYITMRDDKKVKIEMKKQISEAISWFGHPITKKPATPANKNLFNSAQDSPELNAKKSDIFHSIVQKLLCITKRAQ